MTVEIHPVGPKDRSAWLKLVRAYHDEFGHFITSDVAFETWERLLDRDNPVRSRIAVTPEGEVVGFGNYVLHSSTWSFNEVVYIEDIYVDPAYRLHGIGSMIVRSIAGIGHMKHLHWVYALANVDDDATRAFADSVAKPTGLMRYEFKV